jgi:hypothetical protein
MKLRASSPRCLLRLSLLSTVLSLGLALPTAAGADVFGPISLVSASPFQQVEYAHDPAISGDGRYVVFDGSIGGVTGVWRRENRPGGELVQVAGGDAELPSISQDGRYVSFTTDQGLALGAITDGGIHSGAREASNVYVRDMAIPASQSCGPGQSCAFTLASAVSYENPPGEQLGYGAQAAGRTALSADGQRVVFVTTAVSDLDGAKTPPLQVGVHDLETDKTEIVSVAEDPATGRPSIDPQTGQPLPVPTGELGGLVYGAVYKLGGMPKFESPKPFALPQGVGASISADGSTVAWMGQQIREQAPVLSDERITQEYSEPLWRRIADGVSAPTRRVTGGADPANPACSAHPEESLPVTPSAADPCQGPFATNGLISGIWKGNGAGYAVQLSADGETVAFLAAAPLVSQGSDFGANPLNHPSDLYVADMRDGLSRVQALDQLTELAGGDETRVSTDGRVLDLGISPDGEQVAFTTQRTAFPLGLPAYVSAPAAVPGMSELFDVDVANGTLTRVTHGYEGGAGEHPHAERFGQEEQYPLLADGALSPSFSDGGTDLAFSSTASNLVYGDGNTPPLNSTTLDGSDAFVVDRILFGSTPAPQYVSSAPGLSIVPAWELGVTAVSLGDGNVLLYVAVPGAGTLSARVSGAVRTHSSVAGAARSGHRRGARGRSATIVLTRTVASATHRVTAGDIGLTTLLLKLGRSYSALAAQKGGLSARASLTFTASGHPALHQSLAVSFKRVAPKKKAARRSRAAARTHSRGRGKGR